MENIPADERGLISRWALAHGLFRHRTSEPDANAFRLMITRRCLAVRVPILVVSLLAAPNAAAQSDVRDPNGQPSNDRRPSDRIWIDPQRPTKTESDWYPRAIRQQLGTIISLDRDHLRLIFQGDEAESRIAASRVLWIEPGASSEKESAALRQFAKGDYAQSLKPLLDVLDERPPVWRQQWISMLAAYAAWQSSRAAISLELVEQLDQRPLAPLTLAWLPIAWRGGAREPAAIEAATARLADPSPAVQLVAASWLLSSPERSRAAAVLQQLSTRNERPWIARLAETLLWRVATPPQVNQSRGDWQQKLNALPMVLQVGPTITLMEKLRSAGQTESARQLELSLKLTPPLPHPEIDALSR